MQSVRLLSAILFRQTNNTISKQTKKHFICYIPCHTKSSFKGGVSVMETGQQTGQGQQEVKWTAEKFDFKRPRPQQCQRCLRCNILILCSNITKLLFILNQSTTQMDKILCPLHSRCPLQYTTLNGMVDSALFIVVMMISTMELFLMRQPGMRRQTACHDISTSKPNKMAYTI